MNARMEILLLAKKTTEIAQLCHNTTLQTRLKSPCRYLAYDQYLARYFGIDHLWPTVADLLLQNSPIFAAFLLPPGGSFVNNSPLWHPFPSPDGCAAYHPCHRRFSLSLRWLFLCLTFPVKKGPCQAMYLYNVFRYCYFRCVPHRLDPCAGLQCMAVTLGTLRRYRLAARPELRLFLGSTPQPASRS